MYINLNHKYIYSVLLNLHHTWNTLKSNTHKFWKYKNIFKDLLAWIAKGEFYQINEYTQEKDYAPTSPGLWHIWAFESTKTTYFSDLWIVIDEISGLSLKELKGWHKKSHVYIYVL